MEKLNSNQREFKLQIACVEHLNKCFTGVLYFHIPNRGGNATDGYFKKMMGAKAGASDILVAWQGGVGLIELKAPDGRLTSQQNKFFSSFARIGWQTAVCKSVGQFHDTLKRWGHKPKYDSVQEPDYSSKQEKFQAAIDMYRP